jgi:hypothetical protein
MGIVALQSPSKGSQNVGTFSIYFSNVPNRTGNLQPQVGVVNIIFVLFLICHKINSLFPHSQYKNTTKIIIKSQALFIKNDPLWGKGVYMFIQVFGTMPV